MNELRHPFPGSREIEKNYSQADQDLFVLSAMRGKKNGTFLEIGAFDPIDISNTYLLESQFGWSGLSIDIDPAITEPFARQRKCHFLLADALKLDYEAVLQQSFPDKRIDYLSLDIDPCPQTLACLRLLLPVSYRFSVITFEHDAYGGNTSPREESRVLLADCGYVRVCGNITSNDWPFEDWYLDGQFFSKSDIASFLRSDDSPLDSAEYVFLGVIEA